VAAGKGLRAQEPPQVLQHQLHAQQHEAPPRPTLPGPQPGIAHVHLIGEVTGARGLGPDALYCTWQLVFNTQLWSVLAGHDKVCAPAGHVLMPGPQQAPHACVLMCAC
jgi:hypothetical protein